MALDWIAALPGWLLVGLGLGGVLAVVVALVFVVGSRTFPDAVSGTGRTGRDGGETRRRAEIRRYLAAIDERYVEDYAIGGQTVAFYLPEREVAITFDAPGYFLLRRAGIHAILVEHEMPGAHLGGRLPFETPDLRADTESGTETAFALLGLPPSASHEDVKRAYRAKVKEVHPDHGGDAETFRRVREAYDVALRRAS